MFPLNFRAFASSLSFILSLNVITNTRSYIYMIIITHAAGRFNVTMEGVRGTWDISGPVKDDTWIIEHFRAIPTIKKFYMNFENLFEGNREISK